MLGARPWRMHAGNPDGKSRRIASAPPGHPARGRFILSGRSPGLRVVASVQSSRNLVIPVTYDGLQLAAHSCGGSAGLAVRLTGFPLSSGQPSPENHDDGQYGPLPTAVSRRI